MNNIKPGKYYNVWLIGQRSISAGWTTNVSSLTGFPQDHHMPLPLTESEAKNWYSKLMRQSDYEVRTFMYDGSYDPYNGAMPSNHTMPQPLPKDGPSLKPASSYFLSKECPCGINRSDCEYHS
jgi:hypothetical protein